MKRNATMTPPPAPAAPTPASTPGTAETGRELTMDSVRATGDIVRAQGDTARSIYDAERMQRDSERARLDALRASTDALREAADGLRLGADSTRDKANTLRMAEMDRSISALMGLADRLEHGRRLLVYRLLAIVFVVILIARGTAILYSPTAANYSSEAIYMAFLILIALGYALEYYAPRPRHRPQPQGRHPDRPDRHQDREGGADAIPPPPDGPRVP